MIEHHAVLMRVPKPKECELPAIPEQVSREIVLSDQIGIGDVRKLIESANRTPAGDAVAQEIVVITSFITVEAQQALLKIVEEPPRTTTFLFVIPNSLQLLPTLLSRFSVAESEAAEIKVCDIDPFVAFLEAEVKARLEQIETAVKKKDQAWQADIKCGLLKHLSEEKLGRYSKVQLESLLYVGETLLTRGASNKMLLEQLALTL